MKKKVTPVVLNLALMTFSFATMSLYPDLQNTIRLSIGVSEGIFQWSILAYTIGLFAAFLIGHTEFFEHNLKKGVVIAASCAAVPQFIIPYIGNIHAIILLRFVQGFVVSMVPLFSAQISRILKDEKPLAVGIVLSGLFLGGIFGSFSAGPLNRILGWRLTFVLTGVLLYSMLVIWWIFTEVPDVEDVSEKSEGVWSSSFTWIWGLTFFPTIWIVFTIQGFLPTTGFEIGMEEAEVRNLHMLLNSAKVFWSIFIGYMAFRISRSRETDRALFDSYVHIMYISYIIGFSGALLMIYSLSSEIGMLIPFSLFLIAGIQGVGPVFWSSPSLIFPEDMISRGAFALGLLGNSANVVAPIATHILKSSALVYGWAGMAFVCIFGLFIAKLGKMQELPKKS